MVSEHCINQSIDKYINYIYQISPILQVSTSLQDFLHVWFKFSFLYYVLCKRTGITLLVILRCNMTRNSATGLLCQVWLGETLFYNISNFHSNP